MMIITDGDIPTEIRECREQIRHQATADQFAAFVYTVNSVYFSKNADSDHPAVRRARFIAVFN